MEKTAQETNATDGLQVQIETVDAKRSTKLAFNSFEIDLRAGELRKNGRRVRCQPQPFQALCALLESAGEIVTREDLQKAIWGSYSPANADHSLGIAINKLRDVLGDSADAPHFIETIPRRGYRFLAEVEVVNGAETLQTAQQLIAAPRGEIEEDAQSGEHAVSSSVEVVDVPHHFVANTIASGDQAQAESVTGQGMEPACDVALSSRPVAPAFPRSALLWLVAGIALLASLTTVFLVARAGSAGGPRRIDQLTHSDSILPGVAAMESFPVLAYDDSRLYSAVLENGRTKIAWVDPNAKDTGELQLPSEIVNPTLGDISHDGSRLLVRSHISSDSEQPVWIVPRNGGSALRVGNVRAHDAAWMPDGERVLYAAGNELDVILPRDGTTTLLARLPGRAFWMRWSPDGRLLRFTLLDPVTHTSSLWQLAPGGQPERLLVGWTKPEAECCGMWLPDGRSFIFQSLHGGSSDLWQLRGSGVSRPERLTNGPILFTAPMADRSGDRIYCVGLDVRSELERFDPALHRLVVERSFLADADRVSYSRDGAWVAWTDAAGRLWRASAGAGNSPAEKLQLTPDNLQVFLAQWSPDGTSLVAMAREPGGSWQLYKVKPQGGTPELLFPEHRNQGDPTWSNDGRQIAFGRLPDLMGRESGQKQIDVLDLVTHRLEVLPGSDGYFSPRWSPDGRWIAALTLGQQRIVLFDTKTRKWQLLGTVRGADPVWTADSSALYVHAVFDQPQTIKRITILNGADETVVELSSPLDIAREDYVFAGITRENAPLVRGRTTTGNLYSVAMR